MIRILILILLTSISFNGITQTITIYGKVKDLDGDPIPNAYYYFSKSPKQIYRTDVDGNYSISYQKGKRDTLIVKHVGFDKASFSPSERAERKAKKDSIRKDIILPYRLLIETEVFANQPEVVFGTQEYSVADFEFSQDGQMILLTYEKNLEKGSVLRLLDDQQEVLDSYYVPEEALELQTDFRGNVHLVTKEKVFLVRVEEELLNIYPEEREYYFKYVAPVIDSIGEHIYFSNYSEIYPAFDYLDFNREDSISKKILTVEDPFMMELYRSEYKYVPPQTKIWAHQKELDTGIDKEVWVGATVFSNSLYYEPLYAPLFKVGNDTLLVFDHYKNHLFKYVPNQGFVDSVRINYHKAARKSGWEQPLIQDQMNETIYGLFLRNGYTYLSKIGLTDGQIMKSFKLHYKYVEKIQVKGEYVFYIYRPYESVQKKYIYKEKLK